MDGTVKYGTGRDTSVCGMDDDSRDSRPGGNDNLGTVGPMLLLLLLLLLLVLLLLLFTIRDFIQ